MSTPITPDELEVLVRHMISSNERGVDIKATISCLAVNKSFASATLSVLSKVPNFASSVLNGTGSAKALTVQERACTVEDVLSYTKLAFDHPYDDVAQTAYNQIVGGIKLRVEKLLKTCHPELKILFTSSRRAARALYARLASDVAARDKVVTSTDHNLAWLVIEHAHQFKKGVAALPSLGATMRLRTAWRS